VARGLVNHYFGGKRELYLEVVRAMMFVPPLDEIHLPEGDLRTRVEGTVDWLLTVMATHGRTWVAVGADWAGNDPEVRALLDEADDQAALRVLEVIGFEGTPAARAVALAWVRCYGGMVKVAGREWIQRGDLTRAQVRALLVETLSALAEGLQSLKGARRRR
jgi:AcrR family transcriptional regulator